MTTIDVIKLLPMDDAIKTQILNTYAYMEPEQKLSIQSLAWDYYDLVFGIKLEGNMQEQMDQTIKGNGHLGKEFYAKAVKKTQEDMKKMLSESGSQSDLLAARQAMERIVNEIRDAKLARKEAAANKIKPQ